MQLDIDHFHTYGVDLKSNQIFLTGDESYVTGAGYEYAQEPGVEYVMASRFIRNMHLCMQVNPKKPITIHLKTCGGLWEEGMAIYDTIKGCPNHVTIINYTHARSMSSLIFCAGDKRIMMPHSCFMIHDGTYGIEGTVKYVNSNINFSNKTTYPQMMNVYAGIMKHEGSYKGQPEYKIKKHLRYLMDKKEDVFFTPEQAIEYGFAHEIFAGW
jgi:ATP-dependent Clp protease protease subunit